MATTIRDLRKGIEFRLDSLIIIARNRYIRISQEKIECVYRGSYTLLEPSGVIR